MKKVVGPTGLVLLPALAMMGCASIVGGTQHDVAISSEPDGAAVKIVNSAGDTVFTGTTPTTVKLKGGKGYFKGEDYTVTFSKEGYSDSSVSIDRHTSGWYIAGNLVIGGLIGWLIVDPLTGAMYTLDKRVLGVMQPKVAGIPQDGTIRVVSLEDVPANLRGQMVQVR